MDNKDAVPVVDPVLVAQQRVDSLTTYLAQIMDDDDVTLATLQLGREKLTVAMTLLETLLKSKARAVPSTTSTVEFRDKRPPEKTPRMVVSTSGEPFDLPDYLSQVERHWTANMFTKSLWATAFSQFIDNKLLQEEYCRAMARDDNNWSWDDATQWLTKKVPQGDILSAHIKRFLNVRADHESTSVFIHRFTNLMFKAQMSQPLLTTYVFLQSIPTHLHRELMAFVSQQRRNQDPEADAAVNLLEVPVEVLLDALRARLGPDTRITASQVDTATPTPSVKPVIKTPDRPWGKKTPTPTPSPSTPQVTFAVPLAASTETPLDESNVKCFSCQKRGHRATKCPIKPMSLEEHNAVAKSNALQRQRSQLVSDLKTKSLNSLREVFDEDEYQAASAQRTAILQRYRQERKA
jgi:hypothetical protein